METSSTEIFPRQPESMRMNYESEWEGLYERKQHNIMRQRVSGSQYSRQVLVYKPEDDVTIEMIKMMMRESHIKEIKLLIDRLL